MPETAKAEKDPAVNDSSAALYPLMIPMLSAWFLCIGFLCIRTTQPAITKERDKASQEGMINEEQGRKKAISKAGIKRI